MTITLNTQTYLEHSKYMRHLLLYADAQKPGIVAIAVPSPQHIRRFTQQEPSDPSSYQREFQKLILQEIRQTAEKQCLPGYQVPIALLLMSPLVGL